MTNQDWRGEHHLRIEKNHGAGSETRRMTIAVRKINGNFDVHPETRRKHSAFSEIAIQGRRVK